MELRRFLYSMLRMSWLVILLGAVGGTAAVYIFNYDNIPLYSAETTVYALNKANSIGSQSKIDYQDILISRQLTNDYQDILKSERVISMTQKEIKALDISANELKDMISISSQEDSSIIIISAVSNDPKIAKQVSKAVSGCFISTISEMTETNIVGVIDEAQEPTIPISNGDLKPVILGIALGICIAVLIIYLIDFFDTTIRFYEDVEHYTKLPIIGVIPKYKIR